MKKRRGGNEFGSTVAAPVFGNFGLPVNRLEYNFCLAGKLDTSILPHFMQILIPVQDAGVQVSLRKRNRLSLRSQKSLRESKTIS